MALALDGAVTTTNFTTTGATLSKTIASGSNRLLIVTYGSHQGGNASSITYGGTNMTNIVTQTGSFGEVVSVWGMLAPTVGTANIQVNFGGGNYTAIGAYSITGANQGALPAITSVAGGNSGTASLSITPLSNNNWVIDVVEAEDRLTVSGSFGQAQDFNSFNQSFENVAGSTVIQTTAAAQTMSWNLASGQRWNQAAIVVAPASAAAATVSMLSLLGVG